MNIHTKKLLTALCTAGLTVLSVTAQETGADNAAIVLPEVTSTLETTEIRIDPDAVPDFTLVLPLSSIGLPEFKELDIAETQSEFFSFSVPEESDKEVFMEASLGLGYRSSFNGDFSVYRTTGAIPFSLGFSHETVNGFGNHSASEGFNQSETVISGDTAVTPAEQLSVSASAQYRSGSYGLQGTSPDFYNLNHEAASLTGLVTYRIIPTVSITGGLSALYLTQYASLSPSLTGAQRDAAAQISRNAGSWLDPSVGFQVTGANWSVDLTARYATGTTQSRTRADVTFDAVWNDAVETTAAAGIVIATNGATQTVYPFSVQVATAPSVPFTLSACAGLKSEKTDLSGLEAMYPFIMTGTRPYEESAWFGELQYQNTIREYGYVTAGATFEKTAFGNGRLLPDAGQATLTVQDVTVFSTSVGVALPFDLIALSGDWNVSWLDRTTLAPANVVSAGVSYTAESGRYGAQTDLSFALTESAVPFWDLSGFYRLSNAVKLELSGNDLFRFFSDRTLWPGFISRGGYVTLSAHVYF